MGVRADGKATPGITEWLRACYFAVDSFHPGCAEAAKGGVVRPLKGYVSWV
jgi:hypothetical protein